jgi:hypothetical protein
MFFSVPQNKNFDLEEVEVSQWFARRSLQLTPFVSFCSKNLKLKNFTEGHKENEGCSNREFAILLRSLE